MKALQKVQTFLYQRRIRIEEVFRDFDTLNTGFVVVPTFQRAIRLAGYECDEAESLTLVQPYIRQHPDMPGVDTVFYKQFVEDVNICKHIVSSYAKTIFPHYE